MTLYLSILSLALLPSASARLFTVVNACPFTVWHVSPSVLLCVRGVLTLVDDLGLRYLPLVSCASRLLMFSRCIPLGTARDRCFLQGASSCIYLVMLLIRHLYRWESPSLTSAQFAVPDNWNSGRIWVCIFSLS